MRITDVRISSFGEIRGMHLSLGPGLNVVYGKNEAGKSTIKGFITLSLFPKSPVKYPEQRPSDDGTVDVVLNDGTRETFGREGRKGINTAEGICHLEPKEYVSVYSLSTEDLRDIRIIEKGDIRNRFLTIPGANDLPSVYNALDTERNALLPDVRRSSNCGISRLISEEQEASRKVRELQNKQDGDSNLTQIAIKRDRVLEQLRASEMELKEASDRRDRSILAKERKDDFDTMERLEIQAKDLEYSDKYNEKLKGLYESLKKEYETTLQDMQGAFGEQGIDGLVLEYHSDSIHALKRSLDSSDSKTKRMRLLPVLGTVVASAGVCLSMTPYEAFGTPVALTGLATMGVGFLLYWLSKRKGSRNDRKTLESVTSEVKINRVDFETDVNELSTLLNRWEMMKEHHLKAEREWETFHDEYGDEETIEKGFKDNETLRDVRFLHDHLSDVLKDIDRDSEPPEVAEEARAEAQAVYDSYNRELAAIDLTIRNIENDHSVEDAISERFEAENKVYEAAVDWARLMLEKMILDDACTEMYREHSPEVLAIADRYLGLMTGGRYRISADPRDPDFAVIDSLNNKIKKATEWSIGLEDQVKLSIKMAVASRICEDRPPMILDDVLLTSDSERKESACKALRELSKEMQVLYFTCDRETLEYLVKEGATRLDI